MNSKTNNEIFNNQENTSSSNYKQNYLKYQNLVPSVEYQMKGREMQNNLQYFPIITKDTYAGKHTIYLAAQSTDNLSENIDNNELIKHNEKENNNKYSENKNILLTQKIIQFQIKKANSENVKVISLDRISFKRLLGPIEDILKRNMEKYKTFVQ